jgi:hypothetical protein
MTDQETQETQKTTEIHQNTKAIKAETGIKKQQTHGKDHNSVNIYTKTGGNQRFPVNG